jgi:hypothetical protein
VPHTFYLCPVGNIGYGYIFFELVWGKLVEAIFFAFTFAEDDE